MKNYLLAGCLLLLFVSRIPSAHGGTLAPAVDPRLLVLLEVLRSKNILAPVDLDRIATSGDGLERLVQALLDKGVLSSDQYATILQKAPAQPPAAPVAGSRVAPQPVAPSGEMPRAVAPRPLETLPITPPTPSGPLLLQLPSGASLSVNGFIKTNLIQSSNDSSGDDFHVFARVVGSGPETANSTGTTNRVPSFRVKTRSIRTGLTFSAPDIHDQFDISSALEWDWEGNFSITSNNNIGAVRSPAPRLRLAYVRLDTHLGKLPFFLKFGQDWTLFTSSTMATGIEPTGAYSFQGILWERLPGIVAGWRHELGGAWDWKVQPEIGLMLPLGGEGIFANPLSDQLGSGLGSVFTGNTSAPGQAGAGSGQREGVNSGHPHTEGRVVIQYQPFRGHPQVVPSQFIISFQASDRARIFAPPFTAEKPEALQNFILKNQSIGYTAEFRLATPWSTWVGKYYRGTDLRQFLGGLAQDVFYDGPSPFGPSSVLPTMRGVRSQGGFVQWQIPVSVLLNARRPALQGFSANLYYGQDSAFARDARRTGQRKVQHGVVGSFIYQYNRFVQFGAELNWSEMLFTSRQGGALRGGLVGTDLRKEFSTTFMF